MECIIWKLMFTHFTFPETKNEGELHNLNWGTKHQLVVNTNTLQQQTEWYNYFLHMAKEKSSFYK